MSPAVSINNLSKRFGRTLALDAVNLDIHAGEILGLLGPNGAGKTTLISAISGLVRPDAGSITVMGHDVRSRYREARRCLGVVPQELVFDPFFSVRETLRLQSGYFGLRDNDVWIDHVLASLDLTAKADANMRMLSGGMKRRVLVAQALVHRPPVIILDEPTAGVDVELRQTLWQFVKSLNEQGHTIVLTTHYLEEAQQLCDRIAMLKAGKLVALDTTANLLAGRDSRLLRLRVLGQVPQDYEKLVENREGWLDVPVGDFGSVETILASFREHGCQILDMELAKVDLESVFVSIMHSSESSS